MGRMMLSILVELALALLPAAGAEGPPWQDRMLDVPYGPPLSSDRPALRLLRQDFEQLEIDRAVLKAPLRIGTRTFDHGLGTHAVSHIRIWSPEPIARLTSWIGVDNNRITNPGPPIGSVVFSIDGNRREIYRSKVLWAGEEPLRIDVDAQGARILDLRVGDAGNGPPCDWADWCDASITLRSGKEIPLHTIEIDAAPPGARYPFSFIYDGRTSDEILDGWTRDRKSERLDDDRTRQTTSWTDVDTGLKLTWVATRYADFPAVEWLLYMENVGPADTRIVESLQALDLTLRSPIRPDLPYRLHRTKGSVVNPSDFEPSTMTIDSTHNASASGASGKGSAKDFPFFKVDSGDASLIIAIGWSGQWAASFDCPDRKNLHITAGQELTRFLLHPGERVRTPRILILHWPGESIDANSRFRRLIQKHYAARRDGEVPLPIPFCNTCFTRGGLWLNECNAENQIALIRAYARLGIEALLTDAGWFVGGWPAGAGNWDPRKDAYPDGIEPVARAAKDEGMIYGLWFEPERVVAGTAFHREHPDWVLTDGSPGQRTLVANFGLPEVQDHFFGIVERFMAMPGFRVYRQDFNMFPLAWWRHTDAPDRQGITEMKYIEGLYAFWDRIARTWPDSFREECASGGMRIDLETVLRMHVHQKTDYWFDDEADQAHLYGLSQYLPNGVVVAHLNRLDDYSFRSTMASSLCLGWIADDPAFDMARGKHLLGRYRELRHLLTGDWYPLLPYTTKPTEWMAVQYHRADLDEGMILAFRHPDSPYPAADVAIHALDPDATYTLTYDGAGKTVDGKGSDLMRAFHLTLPEKRSSELIVYKRK